MAKVEVKRGEPCLDQSANLTEEDSKVPGEDCTWTTHPNEFTHLPSPKDPRSTYNVFSRLLFCWLDPLFWLGLKRSLNHSDLYANPSEADSKTLLSCFNRFWHVELARRKQGRSVRLWLVLIKAMWWRMIVQGICLGSEVALLVGQSVILGSLSEFFTLENATQTDIENAYYYSGGLVALAFTIVFLHGVAFHLAHKLGMLVRVMLTSAIYQRVLTLSQVTVGRLTIGRVVNLSSNDVHRFDLGFIFYHYLWIIPLHLIAATYLMWLEIQFSALVATALIVLQIPVQMLLTKSFTRFKLKAASHTDSRIKVMSEVISGVRVIKMYAWEKAFKRTVAAIRKTEVWVLLKASLIRALNLSYSSIATPLVMCITFTVFTFLGGELQIRNVIVVLSLLIYIRLSAVHFFVLCTLQLSDMYVALKRIQELLLIDDSVGVMPPFSITKEDSCVSDIPLRKNNGDCVLLSKEGTTFTESHTDTKDVGPFISVDCLNASWSMQLSELTLHDISFMVNKDASLLAVVGPVGAGKSTLLQCLLQELPALSGKVSMKGSLAYVNQEPWIFSSTVRDNIVFGLSYEPVWYNTVVEVCALENDIDSMPAGDLTIVGERGVTLSGGQKARLNLARAVYRKADVYLLDDPLSAVDAAVSRHIFEKCIRGVLSRCCVVLVTHQLQYVQQCDAVLVLKDGCVTFYGDTSDLMRSEADISELLEEKNDITVPSPFAIRKYSVDQTTDTLPAKERPLVNHGLSRIGEETSSPATERRRDNLDLEMDDIDVTTMSLGLFEAASLCSIPSAVLHDSPNKQSEVKKPTDGKHATQHFKVPVEEMAVGSIGWSTYFNYFKAGGAYLFTSLTVIVFIVGECSLVLADWWVSDWGDCNSETSTNQTFVTCELSDFQRIGIYFGLIVGVIVFNLCRTVFFFILTLQAVRTLHDHMFETVLRAPVLFFDTNPVGRVLNRFSKDIGFMDDILPYVFCEYLILLSRFAAIMITAVVSVYYMLAAVALLAVLALPLRWYYVRTARQVKRLEALARSPIYSHLSTTLQGLPTIRAYRMQSESLEQFHVYNNHHSQAHYLYICSTRWFGIRIDIISATFVSIISFVAVTIAAYDHSSFQNAGLIGLALTYAVSLNGMFQYCVRQSAEVENLMVSTERVMAYGRLESEASLDTEPRSNTPAPDWPTKGLIELSDLSYQHSPKGPLVLKGISCIVKPHEKVGIVGRTGAGKSSLIAALFRLAEPHGRITIDGVNTHSLGLHDLRSKMSIIPQDPVLFSGSIRYNLDPFDEYSNARIWKALEQVQLDGVVNRLDGCLEALVSEGGTNFSVGQRQLFCLARALLRSNQILILDEATANVDLETDGIIQEVIKEQFNHCTVLTIAHRLDTVMDSDKIMVLRAGNLCEYGEPYHLLCNSSSRLFQLVEHTGPVASEKLKKMAIAAHNQRVLSKEPSADIDMLITPC